MQRDAADKQLRTRPTAQPLSSPRPTVLLTAIPVPSPGWQEPLLPRSRLSSRAGAGARGASWMSEAGSAVPFCFNKGGLARDAGGASCFSFVTDNRMGAPSQVRL